MRLTKFNPETGLYEFHEVAKTQAEYNEQRKAVIQRLGEIEDKQEVITDTENKSNNFEDMSNKQVCNDCFECDKAIWEYPPSFVGDNRIIGCKRKESEDTE